MSLAYGRLTWPVTAPPGTLAPWAAGGPLSANAPPDMGVRAVTQLDRTLLSNSAAPGRLRASAARALDQQAQEEEREEPRPQHGACCDRGRRWAAVQRIKAASEAWGGCAGPAKS